LFPLQEARSQEGRLLCLEEGTASNKRQKAGKLDALTVECEQQSNRQETFVERLELTSKDLLAVQNILGKMFTFGVQQNAHCLSTDFCSQDAFLDLRCIRKARLAECTGVRIEILLVALYCLQEEVPRQHLGLHSCSIFPKRTEGCLEMLGKRLESCSDFTSR
jgi:hypothetical protein